jgi:hypothetical protein
MNHQFHILQDILYKFVHPRSNQLDKHIDTSTIHDILMNYISYSHLVVRILSNRRDSRSLNKRKLFTFTNLCLWILCKLFNTRTTVILQVPFTRETGLTFIKTSTKASLTTMVAFLTLKTAFKISTSTSAL